MVRRLPVLQNKAPEEAAAEQRPAWQWVFIGAGFALTFWIPILMFSSWVARGLVRLVVSAGSTDELTRVPTAGSLVERAFVFGSAVWPALLSWSLACALAGGLVGRFGGTAGRKHAALAGLCAAFLASAIALLGRVFSSLLMLAVAGLALAATAASMAWLGAKFSEKRRPRA